MRQATFQNSWNLASAAPRDIYNLTNYFLVLKSLTQETHNTRNCENQHEFFFRKNLIVAKFESESHSVVSDSLWPHGLQSPWNSPDQNTGVGSLSLLQGIFPTQGLNPGLLHCSRIPYQLRHKGSPGILEPIPSSDLPDPGIELGSPALQVDSLPTELWEKLTSTECL